MKTFSIIALLLLAVGWFSQPPKPVISLQFTPHGGQYFHLSCPKGWIGYTEWHTDLGDSPQDRLKQYFKDAQQGVCKRDAVEPEVVDATPDAPTT